MVVEVASNERQDFRLNCLIVFGRMIIPARETDEILGLPRSERFIFQIEDTVVKSNEMGLRIQFLKELSVLKQISVSKDDLNLGSSNFNAILLQVSYRFFWEAFWSPVQFATERPMLAALSTKAV